MSTELPEICYTRGDTQPLLFNVKTSAGATQDITGSTFAMTVNRDRRPAGTTEPATNQVARVAGVVTDAANGVVSFTFLASAFNAILADAAFVAEGRARLYYDIQQTDPSSAIYTFGSGRFVLTQDLSK